MSETLSFDLGEKPELKWVDIDKIIVDHNYQREIKPARVAQILREFNWAHFQPVMLAEQTDGRFAVFDGQHRVAAARAHPKVDQVPAAVVRVKGTVGEAEAFIGVNVNRTAITTVEKYWAGIEAGDAAMIRVREVLARAGCEVIQAQGVKPAPHKTTAVTAAERAIRTYGEEAVVLACKTLAQAWPNDGSSLSGIFIGAVSRLFRNNKDTISADRLLQRLRATNRSELAANAETLRKLGGGDAAVNLSKALVEIYNRGLSVNLIQIGAKA
ncbi:DUF6551 family protein [Rhizobium ruizarguesonis]